MNHRVISHRTSSPIVNQGPISFEVFRKTPNEKVQLANAKAKHNALLRNHGFDPKKRLNLSDPMIAIFGA